MSYLFFLLLFFVTGKMFGDNTLGSLDVKMIEVARSVGAACKFTGSGGAAVAFCPEGPAQAQILKAACKEAGFTIEKVIVVPPVLRKNGKTVSVVET